MNSPNSERISGTASWAFILGMIGFLLIPVAFFLGMVAFFIIALAACMASAIALSVIGPKTVSRAAIWSFVFGLLGPISWAALGFVDDAISLPVVFGLILIWISLITGPVGIACAISYSYKLKRHHVSHVGARFAIAGLIFGIANSSLIPLLFIPSDVLFNDPTRAMHSRARNDMRTIATALEAYYADRSCYPQSSSDPSRNLFAAFGRKSKWSHSQHSGFLPLDPGA